MIIDEIESTSQTRKKEMHMFQCVQNVSPQLKMITY